MGVATLGGVSLLIDPDEVHWDYRLKVSRRRTVGGVVVQVYGVELGDMVLTGVFGPGDRSRGDEAGWEAMERFRAQVERWLDATISSSGGEPLVFSYPPRGWRFRVLIRAYQSGEGSDAVRHDPGIFNPSWQLTLFVVEDSTGKVVSGIKDQYIARLMKGVGWKQSAYNGPLSQAAVDSVLAPFGGDLKSYLIDQFDQAAGTTGTISSAASDSAANPTGSGGSVDNWITEAAGILGQTFTARERDGLKIISKHESGNNPKAVNNDDRNAREGHPTKGVNQMRDDTFAEHAVPGHTDIFNPVDNIASSYRYAVGKYGSIDNVPGVKAVRAGRGYVGY